MLHVFLVFRPQAYHYFGAGELTELAEKGSPFTTLVTAGLVLMFAIWGVYALSGADVVKPLPLLRAVLIAIGVIYVLRGLFLPFELVQVIRGDQSLRFIVFSAISLAVGVLYLIGWWAR